jgi:gas vesicle protein
MIKFILGALAGATIGLLLAPKSGEELREDLSGQLNDTIEQGKAVGRRVSKRARRLTAQTQDQLRNVTDAV